MQSGRTEDEKGKKARSMDYEGKLLTSGGRMQLVCRVRDIGALLGSES
jgi:hypothetical protein